MAITKSNLAQALGWAASTVRAHVAWPRTQEHPRRFRSVSSSRTRELRQANVPGVRSPKLARVEAALFAAAEPLSTRRIADVAGLADTAEARVLLEELQGLYAADGTAFTLLNISGGWQLRTRPDYAGILNRLYPNRHDARLTQPAMETLAVVAYRQPVLRVDIELIRGVSCGEMLRQLIDRGLVRIIGHHDSLGRPLLYGTTRRFLEVFGLSDLSNLPLADQLRMPAHQRTLSGGTSKEQIGPADQSGADAASRT